MVQRVRPAGDRVEERECRTAGPWDREGRRFFFILYLWPSHGYICTMTGTTVSTHSVLELVPLRAPCPWSIWSESLLGLKVLPDDGEEACLECICENARAKPASE